MPRPAPLRSSLSTTTLQPEQQTTTRFYHHCNHRHHSQYTISCPSVCVHHRYHRVRTRASVSNPSYSTKLQDTNRTPSPTETSKSR
ncbi:uncharacterized protein M6B38_126655 [Iris pallida]|uniref:Uncharacterized protein n=1 Tax=Iris pallida TaxID=29817 RepID=A0AAX6GFP8_IRIPA|nr:uncharacterized protein M6B38_126655 [Iris pallida]